MCVSTIVSYIQNIFYHTQLTIPLWDGMLMFPRLCVSHQDCIFHNHTSYVKAVALPRYHFGRV